ncbi:MAG: hypothetical protein DA408_19110 [Bacteroidetes bacterium]|nr:MAG: hypothetical protein DA408_19110 [Bacteroidota bacterium]
MPILASNFYRVSHASTSLLLLLLLLPLCAHARIERLRATWRSDPATTMVIGWDQVSAGRPTLYYDVTDHGQNADAYRYQTPPSWAVRDKAMNNVFVRLENLQPNTVYYFVVKDTEGVSKRYSFQTAPNDPSVRLSIIAGSDSRNFRLARCDANRLVSKLRPHCVMFGGDMTDDDSDLEWREWFDDWQLTIGSDGRIFPLIAARGNHEASNTTLVNCFDVPNPNVYYALTLGGSLIRIYTLNTQIPGGGEQRDWLGRDLQANQAVTWRFAQYHQSMRPHTMAKPEREELILQWATLFQKYKVQLAIESDAHVVKITWPVRPSNEAGSSEGFIRDDAQGTTYLGEGGWGAPLRAADDIKPWTRSYGQFNQFNWIFVDQDKIEVRTIKTEGSNRVAEVDPRHIFEPPYGLVIWSPKEGDVVRIMSPNARPATAGPGVSSSTSTGVIPIFRDANGNVNIEYTLTENAQVQLILISSSMQEMARLEYNNQTPGPYQKSLDLSKAPSGTYSLVVKANGKLTRNYSLKIP